MKKNILWLLAIALFSTVGIVACGDDDSEDNDTDPNAALKAAIKENYANIVFANYQDACSAAEDLHDAIHDFVENPTDAALQNARNVWLDSREPYGQTEAFRFASGPIDDEDGPEGLLNAWPLDENYVDYVDGDPNSGIINDATTFPDINGVVLEGLNESGGEKNISIGYHAIEFLLWGQDDQNTGLLTPGDRAHTDYLTDGSGTAANQDRRGEYLEVVSDLLLVHLQSVRDDWDPNIANNYRATFMALDNDVALRNMMTGIGVLSKSELAGERMFVALDNQDQEDEHSCFSDNTHRDIVTNTQGIRNVYTGSYTRTNGTVMSGASMSQLAAAVNPQLAAEMDALSAQSITAVNAIPVPFDNALTQETIGGNGPIMTAVNVLQAQGDKLSEIATALNIIISTDLPE